MSYATAKANFEAIVKKMQQDLQTYAASSKAVQRLVDVRTEVLNKMVEFYQAAEEHISEVEMQNIEVSGKYANLHEDTQRLAWWCQLHRINPNAVFFFTVDELQDMVIGGRRFGLAQDLYHKDDAYIEYITTHGKKPPPDLFLTDDSDEYNQQTLKYLNAQQQCSIK